MRQSLMKKQRYLYPFGCWLILLVYILIIPPANPIAFIAFYLLVYAALYISLLLPLPQKLAMLWSSAVCVYLLLWQFDLDSPFTIILFTAVVATLYMFLRPPSRRRFGK